MTENCHNNGKICLNLLADSLSYKINKKNNKDSAEPTEFEYKWSIDNKKLQHFSNVMVDVIKDFAKTYKKRQILRNMVFWRSR